MAEKRKYLRHDMHCLLKYKVLDESETLGFIRNISCGGVKFHTKSELEVGANVNLRINFPPYPKPIEIVAKVLWCAPLKKIDGFDVGAEFVWIEDDARGFIEEKLNCAMESTPKEKE